jgi:hypothetical protein
MRGLNRVEPDCAIRSHGAAAAGAHSRCNAISTPRSRRHHHHGARDECYRLHHSRLRCSSCGRCTRRASTARCQCRIRSAACTRAKYSDVQPVATLTLCTRGLCMLARRCPPCDRLRGSAPGLHWRACVRALRPTFAHREAPSPSRTRTCLRTSVQGTGLTSK